MRGRSNMNIDKLWSFASKDTLDPLLESACTAMQASASMIVVCADERRRVRSVALALDLPSDTRVASLLEAVGRKVIDSNGAVVLDGVEAHELFNRVRADGTLAVDACIGVPIRNAGNEVIGALCVFDSQQRSWCAADVARLADLAASAVEQIEGAAKAVVGPDIEAALSESQARLAGLANSVSGLIFERRKTGPATWSYTVLGSADEQGPGIHDRKTGVESVIDFVHAEDCDRVLEAVQRSTETETDLDLTFRAATAGESPRWLRSRSVVRHDFQGAAIWDGICFDVSDLMAAREAAQSARLAKDTLLVDVNHELRTPLQAILGFADLLQTETRTEVVQAHAMTIRGATQALLAIVNQLLDLASTEEGAVPQVDRHPTDIKALAESCHGMVALLASAKGLGSHLLVDPDVPASVLADGPKIQQVLVNLLNNAIKFTEAGAVVLHVAATAGGLRFSVSDTGIGIADDKIDLLFQRFSKIQPDGRSTRGSGLGLAIAKQLVESMGGTIGVASDLARGTTFWFELGAETTVNTLPASPGTEPARLGAGSAHILIADDLDLNRKLIADMLCLEGHEVDCVPDGAAAVKAVAAYNYDLVLMDMIMPVMDGIAATRAIRALPAPACDVPIIALTAHSFKEQLDSCLAAGMNATLTKPMSLDLLTSTVRSWTQGRSKAA